MKNISINGGEKPIDHSREIFLVNGALVFLKRNKEIETVFMVIPFRYSETYETGYDTVSYFSLVNLDNGEIPFGERCRRKTNVFRLLYLLLKNGNFDEYDIEIFDPNTYKLDISF
jgi:hypothetical protein